ncbi:MAG: PP2C family serine/threonine-protein phosphatase [Pseudomonadota bacterium]
METPPEAADPAEQPNRAGPVPRTIWSLAKASVRGAQHEKDGRVNQDSANFDLLLGLNAAIVVVSDGHGSAKCFRSDIGSQLAVSVALRVTSMMLGGASDGIEAAVPKLPRILVRRWREAIAQHLAEHPFSEEEAAQLQPIGNEPLHDDGLPERHLTLPYGATVAVAAVTPNHVILAQLGDGKIMVLYDGDETPVVPLADDGNVSSLDTFSLCMPDAADRFRCLATPHRGSLPRLILATTDGYPDSFRTEQDFLQVGADLHQAIRQRGLDAVALDLPRWLQESSREGSGDDCSLAMIWRDDGEVLR